MQYGIYETRKEAEQAAGADAVMQVDGGFQVMDWTDFNQRSHDEAEALFAGGWNSSDKEELMSHYHIDEEHADLMISIIEDLEEEQDNQQIITLAAIGTCKSPFFSAGFCAIKKSWKI